RLADPELRALADLAVHGARPASAVLLALDAEHVAAAVGRIVDQRILPAESRQRKHVDMGARLEGRQVLARTSLQHKAADLRGLRADLADHDIQIAVVFHQANSAMPDMGSNF